MTSRFEIVVLGPVERRVALEDGDIVFVGRDAECDLVLDEPKASRRHTKLWVDGGTVRASDLGSSNGTFLDGARLAEGGVVRAGQILAIGLTQLALVPAGGPAPAMLASTARVPAASGGSGAAPEAAATPARASGAALPVAGPASPPAPIAGSPSRFGLEGATAPFPRQPLPLGTTVVGRLATSDWPLDLVGISQRHARLVATEASLSVTDLGSSNGTFVDGVRLDVDRETPLAPGHALRFGASSWRVVDLAAAAPERPALPAFVLEPAPGAPTSPPPPPTPLVVQAGETIVGRAAACDWQVDLAGISQRHAKVVRRADGLFVTDLGSSNGTFVDGARLDAERETPLAHAQTLRLAATSWRVVRTDLPAPVVDAPAAPDIAAGPSPFPSVPARRLARLAAPVAVAAVAIALVGQAVRTWAPPAGPGTVLVGTGSGAIDPTPPERSPEEVITDLLHRRDYGAAQVALHASYGRVNDRLATTCTRHTRLNRALLDALSAELKADRRGTFFGFPKAQVVRLEPTFVELDLGGDQVRKLVWAELASRDVATAFHERGLDTSHPIDYASFLAFHDHKDLALAFLKSKLADESVVEGEVARLLSELEWRVEPEALGLAKPVFETPPPDVTPPTKPPETVPTPPPEVVTGPTVEQKALEAERARQRTELIRSQAGEVMSLARLLRYEDAIRSMRRLIGEAAESKDLARHLEGELGVLEREQELFAKLLAQVNAGGVSIARLADLAAHAGHGAALSAGDEEFYTIKLNQGQIRERWRYLGVSRMLLLYEELPRTAEVLLGRGIFAYERGELDAANSALLEAKSKSPDVSRRVDQYLAFRLGVAVPPEGFVAYNGRLVTPEEKSMRQSGLVRYRDQWVTPEDKQKYEAGWVKYQGEWVPQDDAKLLAQGFLRYEGRWHSRAELNQIRSVWEKAWVVETPRVHLTSNMDIDFVEELLARLDGAYATYKRYWGKEPPTALRFYAFRTFEDYQKFCLDNKFNQALAAAGFAMPHLNICVGYNKGNTLDSYLMTMVHEGGHLFQGRVNQAVFPSWYAEASATYHESHRWEDASTKKVLLTGQWNPMRYYSVRVAIRDNHWMPYTDLMSSNAIDHINSSHFKAMAFYGQAWALYYYLERGAEEATRKKWYAFREKIEGGALNSGAGRGIAATNAASAALFEQEVMPIAELEAKIKAYFESADRKLDQEDWQKKLAVQAEQLKVYAEKQRQAGGNPLGSERYVPGTGSGSGSTNAGAGSDKGTKPGSGSGSDKPTKPPTGSGSERKPSGPDKPPGP